MWPDTVPEMVLRMAGHLLKIGVETLILLAANEPHKRFKPVWQAVYIGQAKQGGE
jgi:hypothetical protein